MPAATSNKSETEPMPYSVKGYETRASECVELANQARDQMIRMELLNLRQTYLSIAHRLRQQGFDAQSPKACP